MKARKGFTLVEILIVVVILGILAAIVIPQFTDASTQSKLSSCRTTLQSMRSQIELYKIQHNDNPPTLANFEDQMRRCSNAAGDTFADGKDTDAGIIYGPYMQQLPVNPWNNSKALSGDTIGWVYYEDTGTIYVNAADAPDKVREELEASGDAEE